MIDIPAKVKLAQTPTPLQPLRRLQEQVGGPLIWLKRDDMTGSVLTGNKVRKLEFIFAHAIAEGYDAVMTCGGIQSNHCRATALVAAQLGLQCQLILRGLPDTATGADGNQLLDELSGAAIAYYPAKQYVADLDKLFARHAADFAASGAKALSIPTGGSDGLGVWGYIAASAELRDDFNKNNISPCAIVTASGSGGTQAGLVVGKQLFDLNCDVVGINVCDDEAYFKKKIAADIADWALRYPQQASAFRFGESLVNIIDGYVGEGYGKANASVLSTIQQLAKTEGVVLDPVYTGKAFDGLLREMQRGRFADQNDIVFIHTGGVFGLFPYKALFADPATAQ